MRSAGANAGSPDRLRRLARLHGVQPAYRDISGERRTASPEALRAVLSALGVDAAPGRVEEAVRARRSELARRLLRPATPVRAGGDAGPAVELQLPDAGLEAPVSFRLRTEDGRRRAWRAEPGDVRPAAAGGRARRARVRLPAPLPPGYHDLEVEAGGRTDRSLLLAAPSATWRRSEDRAREWGVFLPLYALRSADSWGAGDLGDLERMLEWTDDLGGDVVGVLPLLAGAERSPGDARVYDPVSRLFWNEIYLDVEDAPGLRRSERARAALQSPEFRRRIQGLRERDLVDWRGVREAKRAVLEPLARDVLGSGTGGPEELLRSFLEERPEAETYARFRAVGETRGEPWRRWPAGLREGPLPPDAGDEAAARYHLYAQWLADRQMQRVSDDRDGAGLYLDLPLGCHRDGFDVWRHGTLFADGATVGAPPDDFFREGQDWGFPPPRPGVMERTGFAYSLASLRHHMRVASRLRLDHVMGLHRLFWIPRGMSPEQGVYVRYPSEALHAILCIESHRHRTAVTGEDLGTVPAEVRRAMSRRGIERMYVAQLEARPDPGRCLPRPPRRSVASLGTHDTPTFAGFWSGADIELRAEAGMLEPDEAEEEKSARRDVRSAWVRFLRTRGRGTTAEETAELDVGAPDAVLRATLRHLAGTRASLVLVNLEDLWLEKAPQNVPGTGSARPNFRRKAAMDLEEFTTLDRVVGPLREVDRRRRAPDGAPTGS